MSSNGKYLLCNDSYVSITDLYTVQNSKYTILLYRNKEYPPSAVSGIPSLGSSTQRPVGFNNSTGKPLGTFSILLRKDRSLQFYYAIAAQISDN